MCVTKKSLAHQLSYIQKVLDLRFSTTELGCLTWGWVNSQHFVQANWRMHQNLKKKDVVHFKIFLYKAFYAFICSNAFIFFSVYYFLHIPCLALFKITHSLMYPDFFLCLWAASRNDLEGDIPLFWITECSVGLARSVTCIYRGERIFTGETHKF